MFVRDALSKWIVSLYEWIFSIVKEHCVHFFSPNSFDFMHFFFPQSYSIFFRSLSMGKQLCWDWKSQIFSFICVLYICFMCIFLYAGHCPILFMYESAWTCPVSPSNLFGQADTTTPNIRIDRGSDLVWFIYMLYDGRSSRCGNNENDTYLNELV